MRTHPMRRRMIGATAVTASALVLSGCGFSPYDLPLPGGADLGDHPYEVTADFRDVLDLVPQSGVRFNDLAVGKVSEIKMNKDWTATVTLQVNGDVDLPENAVATIRQTSLLGEKFVSLAPPEEGATGKLEDGDHIGLEHTGQNPEIEEVFSAASLLLNGGGLDRTNTIMKELNLALDGNEPQIKELLTTTDQFLGQLDDNKQALITSLEKVNQLAIATNNQKQAITDTLESLPEALEVVNNQRDELVTLLQALSNLGDVATDVIRTSKADTIANLQALTPILGNLAEAADALAYDFKVLLSYPFVDGMVGGTYAKASGDCTYPVGSDQNTGWCVGDFHNLSIHLNLGAEQLTGLGIDLSQLTDLFDDLSPLTNGGGATDGAASAADIASILQGFGGGGADSAEASTDSSTTTPPSCLLGFLCRTAPASTGSDLPSLLMGTGTTRGGAA